MHVAVLGTDGTALALAADVVSTWEACSQMRSRSSGRAHGCPDDRLLGTTG